MLRLSLLERAILVVEDEPLIALDIATEFEKRGARVSIANTLKEALASVEADGLSAAVLDHALPDGDSTQLCERLTKRGIPFVTYSGYTRADVAGRTGVAGGEACARVDPCRHSVEPSVGRYQRRISSGWPIAERPCRRWKVERPTGCLRPFTDKH